MVTALKNLPLTPDEVLRFVARLQASDVVVDAAAGIDLISALETVKCVSVATQAVVTDAVATAISNERKELGKPKAQWRSGIASQIGLARRESPNRGGTHLGLARALVHEMPHTLARLKAGELNEWRVMILARETACLTVDDRRTIDERLCADPATLAGAGDRTIEGRARALANELDAASQVKRRAKAYAARRTSTRPAPESMGFFTVLTSMEKSVCMWATLRRDADTIINSGGDTRTRDQIMADLVFERVTGASAAQGPPVTVDIVISDSTLLAGGDTSAYLHGYGEIPSDVARQLIRDALDDAQGNETHVALRRLYAHPKSGALTAVESTSRGFPTALGRLIDLRDRTCRTPWCDAPIRHHDHIRPHSAGGKTSAENGAGLCAACNYAKEGEGWTAEARRDKRNARHRYRLISPTGHTYDSSAPPMPVVELYNSRIENVMITGLFDDGAA
ncbi:HNH endonuclease (plasmid) [Rhodococcus pyridinivorans]|uniref:HNH endonuclease n=1 Tax=Mycobacteriales TaxID=85007 RepID=UPI0009EE6581|nr:MULTISPECIES: HNH endonuclease signature motif containing protein [Rhodococcus]MCT7294077.1 HNH endonuclease [Rhodococcus sp. PAE-6]QXU56399.1 HNH endonuclease [Rhodococcus sp. LW-XY12]UQB75769.1 HNH endonuclease [Rhodococcus ruber]UVT27664.1 HNH endonuclease [Rhodococcus pyridinivorans]WML66434.1 HNH endonuclease [Rhodococcus sp. AH-ZY2]